VCIDEVKGKSADLFPCGVVQKNPEELSKTLPDTTLYGWKEAIVFSSKVYVFGVEVSFILGLSTNQ
jgi:hypothetical protein